MAALKSEWAKIDTTPTRRGHILCEYGSLYRRYEPKTNRLNDFEILGIGTKASICGEGLRSISLIHNGRLTVKLLPTSFESLYTDSYVTRFENQAGLLLTPGATLVRVVVLQSKDTYFEFQNVSDTEAADAEWKSAAPIVIADLKAYTQACHMPCKSELCAVARRRMEGREIYKEWVMTPFRNTKMLSPRHQFTGRSVFKRPRTCGGLLRTLQAKHTCLYCKTHEVMATVVDVVDLADREHSIVADVLLACGCTREWECDVRKERSNLEEGDCGTSSGTEDRQIDDQESCSTV